MFIDTSGFYCAFESREVHHEQASKIYGSVSGRMTSSYVLAEYTALAQTRGVNRTRIIDFSEGILSDEAVEIVWVDARLHSSAVELLKERKDKTYSLCDAVSFVLMRERGIAEALTTDKHFEQEGFVRLLR